MDPTSREDLSALMDGELAPEPTRFLLRRLQHDPELGATWSRWHLVRACLQSDSARMSAPAADNDFAARVASAIGSTEAPPQRQRHWARYVGGGALAAGVAVAALVLNVPSSPIGAPAPVAQEDTAVAQEDTVPTSAPAAAPVVAAAPRNALTASPWVLSRQPTVLGAEPASADVVYGTGLMQPGYLRQAAYAKGAVLPYAPFRVRQADPPFSIEWLPEQTTVQPSSPPR